MRTRTIILSCWLGAASLLSATDLKVIHLEGTFDLDGDDRLEFATIEVPPERDHQTSVVRYYEIDQAGFQHLTWELESPDGLLGNFVGVKLGDIDGDATPELVTIMNVSAPEANEILQPYLFLYHWTGEGFSEEPDAALNLARDPQFLRCYNFELLDYDGDGDQEVVASLGAPERGLIIVDWEPDGALQPVARLYPPSMRSGAGFVFVGVVDYDRDALDEIIAFTPEGNVLKAQAYYNTDGRFESGAAVTRKVEGLNKLLPLALKEADWDADGFRDILLPFQSGHVLALTLTPETVVIDELPVDGGPLSDLNVADFDQNGYDDLLLVSGEMNLLTLITGREGGLAETADYFALEGEAGKSQVFATLPLTSLGVYVGSIIGAGWDGSTSVLFLTDLGRAPEVYLPRPGVSEAARDSALLRQEELLTAFPEITEEQLALPQVPEPLKTAGQPLPPDVLPRYVLRVHQSFAYSLPEDASRQFYSFRWLQPPPKGMFFHYESRSIRWTPDETQLGAYRLAYHVEMKVGEEVSLEQPEEDTLATYKVTPVLEGYDERLWIYVNDPPVFLSEPTGTEFVANTLFTYRPLVRDRNPGDKLHFTLEVAPEGMVIEDGVLTWQTDSTHVDVYPVRLVVTDGFDRAVQEFKLFARAGIRILSTAPEEARVNELYTYQVEVWHQDLDYPLTYELVTAPEGMSVSATGLVEWTPAAAQIDTQRYVLVAHHGVATDTQSVAVFVNHPPIVEKAPPPMNLINVGDTWDFQIEVVDPNRNDRLVYTALELPEGMRMDPFTARLRWDPTLDDVDFSHLAIEVSDGRENRLIEADFFVNAPIKIVSIPTMLATVGEKYRYKIMTADRNLGALLPFQRVVTVDDVSAVRLYAVNISDDVYRENIDRYISEWESAETVYLTEEDSLEEGKVSRLNLKKYVHSVFYEDDRLYVILKTVDQRTVKIKDVLWELFQGSRGKPPRVVVERRSLIHYTLTEFPDGMIVDEITGTLEWTPTKDQVDTHPVTVVVSDGYTRDEQTFEIYVNHSPTIVSTAPAMALVGEIYKYQIQVEDKNADADLKFELVKGPPGMQLTKEGRLVWIPQPAQINNHVFTVKVSDGYTEDVQTSKVFVNIAPSVISTPKPVGLTGYEYRYRVVAEDLNKDKVTFRAVRLPKYAHFNKKTGMLRWKPRHSQLGPNDVIIMAIDEHGAAATHQFQIHVFEDPSARRFVNTSWPLMLTFVGIMFAWGLSQI
jgi:hypothetical protein